MLTDPIAHYDIDALVRTFRRLGYATFEGGPHDLNLFGVRHPNPEPRTFDDTLGVFWRDEGGRWCSRQWAGTTDPGLYWLRNPMNVKGTAVLVPDQYRDAFQIGRHKGYPALVQAIPLPVWRDRDRDGKRGTGEIDTGMFGINYHRASKHKVSVEVHRWSAGCQVTADPADFDWIHDRWTAASKHYGPRFTYTLLDAEDVR